MKTWFNASALLTSLFSSWALAQVPVRPVIPVMPPGGRPPVYQPPVGRPPVVVQPPVYQPPVGRPPVVVQPPVYQPPVGRPPVVVQPPIARPPVYQPPVGRPPVVVQPPIARPPVYQPPIGRPPVVVVPPVMNPPAYPVYPVPPIAVPVRPPVYRPIPQPVYPWPVYAPRPIYRPTPIYFPTPLPGSYRVLEGYAQPTNADNLPWYKEFAIQVVDHGNGVQGINLYPDMICRGYEYSGCPAIDRTPITMWVSNTSDNGCGGKTYYAYNDYNTYGNVRSIILTDNTRSYCGDNYRGYLQLVVNYADGSQDLMVGQRNY